MLSAEDALLVERDPDLPGLAVLLDPERMIEALRSAPLAPNPDAVKIESLRYSPATRCITKYTIECQGRRSAGYAKALPRDAVPKARGQALLLDRFVLFCSFPEDQRLRALPRLGDSGRRRAMLARVVPDRPELHDLVPQTVGYKPERRYVARLGTVREGAVALKFFRTSSFGRAKRHAELLQGRRLLALPEWIGSSERDRIAAMRWIEGPIVRDLIRSTEPDLSAVTSTARALAELHAHDAKPETRDAEREVADLRSAAELLGFLLPERAEQARDLASRLASQLATLTRSDALVHGDFYAKQVVLNRDRVYLLDLDTLNRGDPLVDVARFLAHVERDVVLREIRNGPAQSVGDTFRETYRRETRHSLKGLSVHTAAILLQLANYPFRTRHPHWPDATRSLLDRAEALSES